MEEKNSREWRWTMSRSNNPPSWITDPGSNTENDDEETNETKRESDGEEDEIDDQSVWFSGEQNLWIAGALARHAEREGLIQPADDFSQDYHEMFDIAIAQATAESTSEGSSSPGPNREDGAAIADSNSTGTPSSGSESGSSFGSSADWGGFDFGGGFGSWGGD